MRNIKTIVSLPEWAQIFEGGGSANRVADVQTAYERVPLVFRATRIRANALQKIPLHFRRIGAEEDARYPFDLSLSDLIWRTEVALCLRGGAVWLKKKTEFESLGYEVAQGLAWLNPFTVTITWNDRREFVQYVGGARYPKQGVWTDEDIVFIREFAPLDDMGWGVAPAAVALGSGQLAFYLNRVASVFFEHGAMPVTLATIAGLSNNPEEPGNKRIREFFRRAMSGIGNAFRILAVSSDVKMVTTQAPLKDMVIPELKQQARKDVALAFEIPVTLLDDDANYATAREHKRGFYDETIIPRARLLQDEFNRQWLNPLGYEIQFAPEEMDLYQEDESARANSLMQLVTAITTSPEVARFSMRVLGYDLSEEQARELEAMIAERQARRVATAAPPAAKAIERRQFRNFVKDHPERANQFRFFHLDAAEQAALQAEVEAQPSDTGGPFRLERYRRRLREIQAGVGGAG